MPNNFKRLISIVDVQPYSRVNELGYVEYSMTATAEDGTRYRYGMNFISLGHAEKMSRTLKKIGMIVRSCWSPITTEQMAVKVARALENENLK